MVQWFDPCTTTECNRQPSEVRSETVHHHLYPATGANADAKAVGDAKAVSANTVMLIESRIDVQLIEPLW